VPAPTFTDGTVTHQADMQFLLAPAECSLRSVVATSFTSGSEQGPVPFALTDYDSGPSYDGAMHSNSTFNSRITITTPGRYDIAASLSFVANATGKRNLNLRKNAFGTAGTGTLLQATAWPSTLTAVDFCTLEIFYPGAALVANDVLELFVLQSSGGALTLATAIPTTFRARWVSP